MPKPTANLAPSAARRRASKADAGPAEPALSYEDALAELDALLTRLDSGSLPLDALLAEHQRASELLALCRTRLEALEQQLTVLDTAPACAQYPQNP